MTQITVDRRRPVDDLAHNVDQFSLLRYKLITFLHLAFLSISLIAFCGFILALFLSPGSVFATTLLNHVSALLGTGGATGAIGSLLKALDQRDQDHLDHLQFIRLLEGLPDNETKEQVIRDHFKGAGRRKPMPSR